MLNLKKLFTSILNKVLQQDEIITDYVNNWGTKNLLSSEGFTSNDYSYFTINEDGTVVANGTAYSDKYMRFYITPQVTGNYYYSACPTGGSSSTYSAFMRTYPYGDVPKWNNTGVSDIDYGTTKDNEVYLVAGTKYQLVMSVKSGYAAENLTFYPMIRPGSVENSDYVPYTMSNQEMSNTIDEIKDWMDETGTKLGNYSIPSSTITQSINTLNGKINNYHQKTTYTITLNTTYFDAASTSLTTAYKYNDICYATINGYLKAGTIAGGEVLATGFPPPIAVIPCSLGLTNGQVITCQLSTDGELKKDAPQTFSSGTHTDGEFAYLVATT